MEFNIVVVGKSFINEIISDYSKKEKEFKHELNELKEEKKFIDEKIISIIKKIFVTIPDLEIEIFETKMTESDIFSLLTKDCTLNTKNYIQKKIKKTFSETIYVEDFEIFLETDLKERKVKLLKTDYSFILLQPNLIVFVLTNFRKMKEKKIILYLKINQLKEEKVVLKNIKKELKNFIDMEKYKTYNEIIETECDWSLMQLFIINQFLNLKLKSIDDLIGNIYQKGYNEFKKKEFVSILLEYLKTKII